MYSKKGILAMTLALAQMSRAFENPRFINPSDPLDGIDLAKEYELIQQKKSGLSANLRKQVVYRYEKILKERELRENKRSEIAIEAGRAKERIEDALKNSNKGVIIHERIEHD